MTIRTSSKTHKENSSEFKKKLPKGGILLPYQKEWLVNSKKYPVSIWEKSRRIGASWVVACEAVMNASKKNHPVNTYYISYETRMEIMAYNNSY